MIFPSNRGGYCIQPQKKEYSLNYKCSFPSEWLGLENEELQKETGLVSAGFCHKGGFLLTTGTLEDAVKACEISLAEYREEPVLVNFGGGAAADKLLGKLPEILNFAIRLLASSSVCSGERKNGSVMTPFSERFTLSTSSACASIDMFL